jgi:hypothetical protein
MNATMYKEQARYSSLGANREGANSSQQAAQINKTKDAELRLRYEKHPLI